LENIVVLAALTEIVKLNSLSLLFLINIFHFLRIPKSPRSVLEFQVIHDILHVNRGIGFFMYQKPGTN
jgi:hypothetical protein